MARQFLIGLFLVAIIWQSGILSLHTIVKIKTHRAAVKAQMKAALKTGFHDKDLDIFTEAELKQAHWEHSKEFFLNHHKYDVVKTEKTKAGIIYYCILDSKEIALYKSLDRESKTCDLIKELFQKFHFLESNSDKAFVIFPSDKEDYNPYAGSGYRFTYCQMHLRPPLFKS